ncbi:uncharacterized protein PAC_18880 [Phialocephala subalpina]|uniref:NACHT domain-containing protein n=1 Tax=Phialocephala subalpina TaxID=576137 RepID=A0A1L7XVF0_9HELO|nr:uncharacterized protein PAC_18880 [Phialocephala subalpina]
MSDHSMTHEDQDFVVVNDKDLAGFNSTGLLPQSPEDVLKIRQWLQPTEYEAESSEYKKHLSSFVPGTGEWIQKTDQYQQWLQDPNHGTLWLKGVAGSGKSVVAAHVAAMASTERVPVLSFFFRQTISTNKTPQSLLRDWLAQILGFSPSLQLKINSLLENRRTLDSMAFDELWDLLVQALSERQRVYCIADAIDEMDLDNEKFMRKLIDLGRKSPSTIKVFITSRPLPCVEKALSEPSVAQILLQSQLVHQDISLVEQAVRRTILYARLMLDQLLEFGDEPTKVDDALQKLPIGLGQMYSRMLSDHSERTGTSQELQLFILQSVTHASRPLRLLELAAITDFVDRNSETRLIASGQTSPQDTKSIIRHGCGPLLEILEDETVSIIHHSLTEFLTDVGRHNTDADVEQFPCISGHDTHVSMAKLCVEYLLSGLRELSSKEDENTSRPKCMTKNARMTLPFLDYSLNYLYYHILKTEESDETLFLLMDRLLVADPETFSLYMTLLEPEFDGEPSPLHLVASKGLAAYTKHLIQLGQDIECLDPQGQRSLHHAASNGHVNVVRTLLERGASNNPDDKRGHTPLHLASSANRSGVVKILLAAGVDPLTPKTKEDPGNWCGNAARTKRNTALEYASTYGHAKTTETVLAILTDSRVDVNRQINHRTLIHLAAHAHDVESMEKLLHLGADVNIRSNFLFDNTGVRCMGAEDRINPGGVEGVPDAIGCRVLTGSSGWDPKEPYPEIVEFLLDHGADASLPTKSGSTVLHLGTQRSEKVVGLLVSRGADLNARLASNGRTPIYGAADPTVLIKFGADCNVQDNEGNTPLHVAMEGYSPSVTRAKVLLENGVDPNKKNKKGNTAIHNMHSWLRQEELLRALLAAGADLESKTVQGRTVLLQALEHDNSIFSYFECLVEAGADINARDFKGRTVLHYCCAKDDGVDMLRKFVEKGADPLWTDFAGNTLFHQIARQQPAYSADKQLALFNLLLELGVSPSMRNNVGQTPFHTASSMWRGDMRWSSYKTDPFKFLLGPKCNLDVNAVDDSGVCPIHLAASLCEPQVRELLNEGADLAVFTLEGLSPLHVAARSRQTNVVGLLVEEYIKREQAQIIDQRDIEGRTALHYAARSGRSETVAILLSLGASNVNIEDNKGLTPLDVCSEIRDEDLLWKNRKHDYRVYYISAPGVKLSELNRPYGGDNENSRSNKSEIKEEADKIGCREIIRLLVAHGADISFMVDGDLRDPYVGRGSNAFIRALDNDCEAMADELLELSKSLKREDVPKSEENEDDEDDWRFYEPWNDYVEKYVLLRSQSSPGILKNIVKPGEDNLPIFQALLKTENEVGIAELKKLDADLLKPDWHGGSCITLLVKFGYATLLKKYGADAALMNDAWIEETEKTNVNLPGRLKQLLLIACGRKIWNLDVIKVLVDDFKVDINARCKKENITALHVLASSQHWWQSHALEYLLQHGVSPEIKNGALHVAIHSRRGEVAAEILLRYGADPNFVGEDGLTCLNNASQYPAIVRDLIKYGADASGGKKPFVFDAIKALDLDTINLLVEMKTDLNLKPEPEPEPELSGNEWENRGYGLRRLMFDSRDVAEESYPIHYAASREFNKPESREKILSIIEALLRGGADPFLPYNDKGDFILHELCESDGIIEPFISHPNFASNIESRDSQGRTLLLAACSTNSEYFRNGLTNAKPVQKISTVQLLFNNGADITAIDNDGRNAVHHLLTSSERYEYMHANDPTDFVLILSHELGSQLAIQKDNSGATPLQHALRNKQLWAIEPLLTKGADPLEADPKGNTALHHLASQFTYVSYAGLYSEKSPLTAPLFSKFRSLGVDINSPNALGETPIFNLISSEGFCREHLQMFEEKGVDLKVKNAKGQGLLHGVARMGSVECFRWLMGKGLDAREEDGKGRTGLDVAVVSGREGILEIFKRDR